MNGCVGTSMVLAVVLAWAAPVLADPVWVPYGTSEYALTETGGTWLDCEAEALVHQGHLVAVNDAEENAWLVTQFGVTPRWIGLSETDNDGIYVWSNGDTLDFTAWAPHQPDWLTWDHDYVSINLLGNVGLWHNSHVTGYPGGTPGSGIMERPGSTGFDGPGPAAPALRQNTPNPFNPMTEIRFELPAPASARLVVYDLAGRELRVLAEGEFQSGIEYRVSWNGRDATGEAAPSGCYVYRLESDGFSIARRMVLLR
jgi:hypothetical protein